MPETDSTTVGGWVMELLGHIPTVGEVATVDAFRFLVQDVENQTVKRIRLEITVTPPSETED
jgi:CBS domain containing-hemolysin-like protein